VEKKSLDVIENANKYLSTLKECLGEIPLDRVEAIVEILDRAYQGNKQVFIMGNGGSASTASHFACDLGMGSICDGGHRFRVMSLNDNISLMTALSNDLGYDQVFREQLSARVDEGDVVIGITASGNSANVLQAIEYARARGAVTIGLIGFEGGALKDLVQEPITVSCKNYGQVEAVHLVLTHLITQSFREKIARD
jgi:D-sedoheptulose 7-phosphate isomerase